MIEQPRDQKDEKLEKHDEKEEKERGEKTRNDPLSTMVWAAILIWAGIVFLGQNLLSQTFFGTEPWSLVFLGAGVIILFEALIRTVRPEYRRPIGGTLIFGAILIAIGLGERFDWQTWGPVALIVLGAGLLVATLLRKR